ncbi:hypothetical protein AB0N64_12005 [Microbacterium sp. NPDC089318]
MSDVEIFYAELQTASSTVDTAIAGVLLESADLGAEDSGIGNPASRTALRLALHRHLSGLGDAVRARVDSGSQVSASARRIADRYTDLDIELTGQRS